MHLTLFLLNKFIKTHDRRQDDETDGKEAGSALDVPRPRTPG